MLSRKEIPYKFILFLTLFLIADFVIENLNNRLFLNDFKVYYEAANSLTGGGQVYDVDFSLSSGNYKYSPFTALWFYPLSILPYHVACIIDFVLNSLIAISTFFLLFYLFNKYIFKQTLKSPNLVLFISLLCIATHLVRELHLGNLNMLLLLLLSSTILFIIQNRIIPAGLCLAFIIITKPFFILLLIPLVMRKYFKTMLVTGVVLILFIVIPAFILGVDRDIELHKQWLITMLNHANGFPSPNTLKAILQYYLFIPDFPGFQYLIMIGLLIPCALFMRKHVLNNVNEEQKSSDLIMEWFILIAIMPSIFKTDTEHFLMTLPVILFILGYIFLYKNVKHIVVFIVMIILFGGNIHDLIGHKLSISAYNAGVLGIGNVLLTAFALAIYSRGWNLAQGNKL